MRETGIGCEWRMANSGQGRLQATACSPFAARYSIFAPLNAHRHQHIDGAGGVAVLDQCRRARIGQLQQGTLALDLGRDVEQVARVEPDIERIGLVLDLELLGGAARIRVGHRQYHAAGGERQFDRPSTLARDGRDAVDGRLELRLVDDKLLVVADRNHSAVVRERAVDQLRGEHHVAEREPDLARRQLDSHLGLRVLDQPLHFADRLAWDDDARHAGGAGRRRQLDLGEAMTVGRHRPQRHGVAAAGCVQIDAVKVVAGLLGRDRELRLVDQSLEIAGHQAEAMRHLAGGKIGKIGFRQGLQGEARPAGADGERGAIAQRLQHDLRAVGQLAHDVVEHVRRHRGGAGGAGFRRHALDHLEIEVRGLQAQRRFVRPNQHVGEDRDGVAALDDAVHVTKRFQQGSALDGELHEGTTLERWDRSAPAGAPLQARRDAPGPESDAVRRFRQGQGPPGAVFYPGDLERERRPGGVARRPSYSCSRRLSSSISSASVESLSTSPSILRTACSTVVWSRPPKRRPISGSERSVSVLARYMAIWRGRTTLAVRRDDRRSARLTLYWRATVRWMSSILTRLGSCGRTKSRTARSAMSMVTGAPLSLLWASRRLSAPSRSRPLCVTVRAMKASTGAGTSKPW